MNVSLEEFFVDGDADVVGVVGRGCSAADRHHGDLTERGHVAMKMRRATTAAFTAATHQPPVQLSTLAVAERL